MTVKCLSSPPTHLPPYRKRRACYRKQMKRPGIVGSALALMLTYSGSLLVAECPANHPPHAMKESGRVLEGTVTMVEGAGYRAAFTYIGWVATVTVHRVWKGALTPEATFYFGKGMHEANLEIGERRVLFGMLMDPSERVRFGIPDDAPPSFFVRCYGALKPEPSVIRQLGRARTVPNRQ